jgi:hypothetical protein
MLKDPTGAVKDYLESFATMEPARRAQKVLKIFGNEAGRFVLKAVTNLELLDNAMKKAASDEALGSMDREFQRILERSSTAGKRIKETWLDITRAIGTGFLRMFDKYSARLIKISDWLLGFVKAHPTLVKIAGIMALIAVAVIAIIIPLGFMMIAVSALIPVITALGVATSFIIGLGALMWIAWSPLIIMFGAVALAAASVAAAIYQIKTNWEAMTSSGAGKDLLDYLTNRDPERLAQPNRTEAEDAALEKSQERIAAKKNAGKMTIDGEMRVTAGGGATVESASMTANAGSNIPMVAQ